MRAPSQELSALSEADLLRTLKTYRCADLPLVQNTEAQSFLNFSSNDYLGLSQHPALKEAAITAITQQGTGATASRLVCGTYDYHRALENKIAQLKQTDDALLFANGYTTALGTITALLGKEDTIILDKLSHASLIDAARLSGAHLRVFPHNNLNRLEEILKATRDKSKPNTRVIVVTESVFSMDGDLCPLPEIIALKKQYDALLFLDEAHALGVLGPQGLGLAEALGLQQEVDLQMGTLGKAAGSAGGYLAAEQSLIDLLVNKARSFIYSTAPPPAQVASASAAFDIITSAEGASLREKLRNHLSLLHSSCKDTSLNTKPWTLETPILPLILGNNDSALSASQALRAKGFLVPAIRYPTVPKNTARLRITLSAAHSAPQIQSLAEALTFGFASKEEIR